MSVVSQKDSGPRRSEKSEKETRTVAFGVSFAHVARGNSFDSQAILPKLRAPSRKRRKKINADRTRREIVMNARRAHVPKNEPIMAMTELHRFFETEFGKPHFNAATAEPVKREAVSETAIRCEDDEEDAEEWLEQGEDGVDGG